jgi:hypothetical protein
MAAPPPPHSHIYDSEVIAGADSINEVLGIIDNEPQIRCG